MLTSDKQLQSSMNETKNIAFNDLVYEVKKYKIIIFIVVLLSTFISTYYVFNLPDIYQSRVLIVTPESEKNLGENSLIQSLSASPNNNKVDNSLVVLRSQDFLIDYAIKNNLKHKLFSNQWDSNNLKWRGKEPSNKSMYKLLRKMISNSTEGFSRNKTGLYEILVEWEDPINLDDVSKLANGLAKSINESYKESKVDSLRQSILFLNKEIDRINVLEIKNLLYKLIQEKYSEISMLSVNKKPVFEIIDTAKTPEIPVYMPKKTIVLVLAILAFFSVVFLIFIASWLRGSFDN